MSDSSPSQNKRVPWGFLGSVTAILLVFLLCTPALVAQSVDSKTQSLLSLFQFIYLYVQNNYVDPVDGEKLIDGALKGLFESLEDPHSAYLTETDMRTLNDTTAGEFGGVGLYINKQIPSEESKETSSFVEVVAPIEGTPAFHAGIQAGDLIVKIEGESTEKLSIDEVVNRLRGKPGTTVTVTVQRGAGVQFDVPLIRAVIQVPTVRYDTIPGRIGYIRIIQFTPYTDDKVQEAIETFRSQGYRSLIIDLRSNPGGLLSSVVETADLFFDEGVIVSTRSRIPAENAVYEAKPGTIVPADIPIAVLIDNGSASASEIFAGVMKDRKRATLLGTKTYGKGSVQQVRSLGRTGFRLTTARYYTPSGVTIDKVGVSPDLEVKEPTFSEKELEAYSKLLASREIAQFVSSHPNLTDQDVEKFVESLRSANPDLSERVLKRMVRNEIHRHLTNPPVYDLEYDLVLQEAVKFLKGEKN
ncbi:MAG TPA: S41 family peptidase [Spirochaetales bacterium]|nr:S41 family peptidase [Spirochaetales bacterium]HOV37133.1 S41 family peptidase [Spirochaetales bacterium]